MDYQRLIGHRLGPGPGLLISEDRLRRYHEALGLEPDDRAAPLLFIASLLPALGTGMDVPLPPPEATINYGLDRLELVADAHVGDRLQATFRISKIEAVGTALQINRSIEVTANDELLVVVAEVIARWVY